MLQRLSLVVFLWVWVGIFLCGIPDFGQGQSKQTFLPPPPQARLGAPVTEPAANLPFTKFNQQVPLPPAPPGSAARQEAATEMRIPLPPSLPPSLEEPALPDLQEASQNSVPMPTKAISAKPAPLDLPPPPRAKLGAPITDLVPVPKAVVNRIATPSEPAPKPAPLLNWSSGSSPGTWVSMGEDTGANGKGNGDLNGATNGNGAQEGDENGNGDPKREHIRDNAILVEEAFNQEKGQAQHIFVWGNFWDKTPRGRTRDFTMNYTMELPIGSQKHQFSFTTQYFTAVDQPLGGPTTQLGDIGDTFLNYRYQLLANDDFLWCAPRFTLILPTGDKELGFGTGEVGYQFNLPISHYGNVFDFHFNLGYTFTPNVSVPVAFEPGVPGMSLPTGTGGLSAGAFSVPHNLHAVNTGFSVYWKPRQDFHLYVETLALWGHDIDDTGTRVDLTQVFLSPGLRFAIIQDPVEWVLGVAVPVGLTRDTPDIGVFAYMSIEHGFRREKKDEGK